MKTNQTMQLDFDGKTLPIEHKTKMGSLTDLWAIGNSIRKSKGLTEMNMSNYLHSNETLELVQAIEKSQGFKSLEASYLKNSAGMLAESIKSPLIKTKRGRHGGGTWAHLYILLDAASRMDADFKVKMFDILVEGKLLEWRDDSGDSFKALNIVLDTASIAKTGSPAPTLAYIKLANAIRRNVFKNDTTTWNEANYRQLKRRTEIENHLMSIIKLNLMTDFNHLLDIAEKL